MTSPDPSHSMSDTLNAVQAKLDAIDQNLTSLDKGLSPNYEQIVLYAAAISNSLAILVARTTGSAQHPGEEGRDASKEHEPMRELLKTLASASVILAVPLYAAGWAFLYEYYKRFGLNISDLDLPIYETLVFSLRVLCDNWLSTLCLIAGFLFFALVVHVARKFLATSPGTVVFLLALLLLGYALSRRGAAVGQVHAGQDMMEDNPNLPLVAVLVDAEAFQKDGQDYLKFDKLEFKLLIHANGRFFFFRPLKQQTTTALPSGNQSVKVFVIPDKQVRVVRVQRGVSTSLPEG